MVAPLIAAAGRGLMNTGANWAGPQAAKSAAGSILKTGKGSATGSTAEMKSMFGDLSKSLKGLAKVAVKILDVFSKASPMLMQQMVIINKSLLLFLRPIGDIMAKFLRPMALWLIKVAMKWNQLFGGNQGDNKGPGAKEDALTQAKKEKTAAEMRGDTEGVKAANKKIAELSTDTTGTDKLKTGADNLASSFAIAIEKMSTFGLVSDELAVAAGSFWQKVIPESLLGLWESVKTAATSFWEVLKELWNTLSPILIPLWDLVKVLGGAALTAIVLILTQSFQQLSFVFNTIKTVLQLVQVAVVWLWEGLKGLWEVLKSVGTFLKDTFVAGFDKLLITITSVYNFIKDTFIGIFDKLLQGFKNFINKIIDVLNLLPGVNIPKLASGGEVSKTGIYQLHAGERVLPAGEARTRGNNKNMTFTNHFNITANVSNDVDIKELARKLSAFSEVEMRRRSSYI